MKQHDIILIANEPWENYSWRRRHYIAWSLSKLHKVLFVEPPYDFLTPLIGEDINWKQLFNLGRLKHQGRNLYTYSPFRIIPLSFPFSRVSGFHGLNEKMVRSGLSRASRRLGMKHPILWVNFSDLQYEYYTLFDSKLVVADWYDKFDAPLSQFAGEWATSESYMKHIRGKCESILEHADIVFAVSKELHSELVKKKEKTFFIPHGADCSLYEKEIQLPGHLDGSLHLLSHPIVGYIGTIQAKLDFDLLCYLKENHPEWTVLLVGREHINNEIDRVKFETLKKMKGVCHIGHVNPELIPGILKHVDVCTIPLKINEFNYYTSGPLKLWEYLAAGKPIVAIDQGSTFECGKFVKTACDKDDFENKIIEALAEKQDIKEITEKRNIAKENSWDRRADKMLELIEKELNG